METAKELISKFVDSVSKTRANKTALIALFDGFCTALQSNQYENSYIRTAISDARAAIKRGLSKPTIENTKKLKWLLEISIEHSNGDKTHHGIMVTPAAIAKKEEARKATALKVQSNEKKEISVNRAFILDLLSSQDISEMVIGLALATGRRSSEILCSGRFSLVKNSSQHLVFAGQLKTESNDSYIIPVAFGIKSSEVLAASKILNKSVRFDTPEAANAGMAMRLSRAMAKLFGKDNDGKNILHFHDTRKTYAAYCLEHLLGKDAFFTIKDDNNKSIIVTDDRTFLQMIMGHSKTDVGKHYGNITLK